MNIALRFKNPTTCSALILAVVAFIYQILGLCGVVPAISQDTVIQVVGLVISILTGLGILVDPTTKGVGDSTQAMSYQTPKADGLQVGK